MNQAEATANIIVRIENELKNGCSTLLDKVVKDIHDDINIIAERIEGDHRYLLFTFFWINSNPQPDEILIGKLMDSQNSEGVMRRLEGTNIWYVTFKEKNALSEIAFIEKRFAVASLQYRVKPDSCCVPAYSM